MVHSLTNIYKQNKHKYKHWLKHVLPILLFFQKYLIWSLPICKYCW